MSKLFFVPASGAQDRRRKINGEDYPEKVDLSFRLINFGGMETGPNSINLKPILPSVHLQLQHGRCSG
jgi:hypothetical protein